MLGVRYEKVYEGEARREGEDGKPITVYQAYIDWPRWVVITVAITTIFLLLGMIGWGLQTVFGLDTISVETSGTTMIATIDTQATAEVIPVAVQQWDGNQWETVQVHDWNPEQTDTTIADLNQGMIYRVLIPSTGSVSTTFTLEAEDTDKGLDGTPFALLVAGAAGLMAGVSIKSRRNNG